MVTKEYIENKYRWKYDPIERYFVYRNVHISFNLKTNKGKLHGQDYSRLMTLARKYKIPESKFDIIQESAPILTRAIDLILDTKRMYKQKK